MGGFVSELKRRNVFRVGAAYAVVSWLTIQVIDKVFPRIGLPESVITFILIVLLIGFPTALVLDWVYELTPEGMTETKEAESDDVAIPGSRHKSNHVIADALVAALGIIAYQNLISDPDRTLSQNSEIDKSVAVLPFDDLSERGDQEWFAARGLTWRICF